MKSLVLEQTKHDSDGRGYLACLECKQGVVVKRMLCNTCYQRAYRNGSLWQYVNTEFIYDYDDEQQDRLDAMIRWIFEFDYDLLVFGLMEYVQGPHEITRPLDNVKYGSGGYGLRVGITECFECGEQDVIAARGLCKRCYEAVKKESGEAGLYNYPTLDYVKNPRGHIYFVLNYHYQRVVDIAREYGIEIKGLGTERTLEQS